MIRGQPSSSSPFPPASVAHMHALVRPPPLRLRRFDSLFTKEIPELRERVRKLEEEVTVGACGALRRLDWHSLGASCWNGGPMLERW